jgi:hypothetical protein
MKAPVHHILALTSIVRERMMPVAGTVHVRLNQNVNANDIVAEASWAREHILLDVARTLHMTSSEADQRITCRNDDRLPANSVIAVGKGMFPARIRTPREGRVVVVGGGQVLLEVGVNKLELRAGLAGTVIDILPGHGAVIRATGALIQGVWGNNRSDSGMLVNLADKPNSVLSAARLDASMRGSIVLAGLVKDSETLQAAAAVPLRGLILSSITHALLQTAREMRYPIVVTDGFGMLPMNSLAYKLLSTNAKREVSLNAEPYNRYTGARPEIIIPLPFTGNVEQPPQSVEFSPGQQVRMRRAPSMGSIGMLVELRPGLTILPGGLRVPAGVVKIEAGESVIVPLVNLEVVG